MVGIENLQVSDLTSLVGKGIQPGIGDPGFESDLVWERIFFFFLVVGNLFGIISQCFVF